MTKKEILKLTGLTESEFYNKYPTKESFEKDMETYKKGGIYIKPENRGKFTATKKRTGKTTEELTHSKNPLTRKRAIFAQNAKKWKHAEGGFINPELLKNITGSLSQLSNMKTNQSQIGQPPQQSNTGKSVGSIIGGIAGSLIPIPGVGTALGSTVGGMIGGAIDKKSYENKVADYDMNNLTKAQGGFKKGGELIKRADGSYSRRGLWDNIRANKGSGKKPTKEMLEQEKKIKAQEKSMGGNVYADGGKLPKNILKSRLESHMSTEQANAYLKKYAKGGKLEHLGDNLYKVKSHIKGTDKVEVRPNVFFDDKEVVRKNSDGSMQILSDDLGYAKPVEKVAKAMGGKAAQSLFNAMYTKQEMSKAKRPVDKFADNAKKRMSYVNGGLDLVENYDIENIIKFNPKTDVKDNNFDFATAYNAPGPKADFSEQIIPITRDIRNDKDAVGNISNIAITQPFNDKKIGAALDQEKQRVKRSDEYTPSLSPTNPPTNLSTDPNLYKMDQISPWWLLASEAGNIANMLMSRPDDVNLDRYKPTLVDPYRANKLLASELRKQANAASSAIRGTANTQGTYLASEIANRSRLNEAIGSQLAQSNLQSLLSNTDLINKAKLANLDISTTEKDLRQREKDASRSIRSQALSQMGSNIMQYGRDRKQVDMTNKMLPFISPEGYQLITNPDSTIGFKRKFGSGVNNLNFSYTEKSAGENKRFGGKIYKK
jgi:hypothetical protein